MNNLIDKYIFLHELTNGEFGKIYKARHKISNADVVFKIENKSEVSLLLYEAKLYNELKKFSYISHLRNFTSTANSYIMIIDYNGPTLLQIKTVLYTYPINERINFINKLIYNIISAYEELHSYDYLYRDTKPHNFCYKNNNLKIIDLGFCKKYKINNVHIENKKIMKIVGTPNYVSLNVVNLDTPSRRDDLESLIYLYLFLLISEELWNSYSNISLIDKKDESIIKKILDFIQKNEKNEKNLNNIIIYFQYIRSLSFTIQPDYNKIKLLIKSI